MADEQSFTPSCPLHTPVLFLVYKRPDTTRRVFEAIRQAKPPRLYVAADGPKADVPGEAEKVQQVRDIILDGVDWDCEVKTLFRDKNLGCKYGVSGGIDWFFENEEEGIILEDDTLPSQSFFWFCQELLERYRNDKRIGQICGRYELRSETKLSNEYFITSRGFIWGWATWRRCAYNFDVDRIDKEVYSKIIIQLLKNSKSYVELFYRIKSINAIKRNYVCTWDYPWNIHQLLNDRYCIIPYNNLILNIGYGAESTHTKVGRDHQEISEVTFPLKNSTIINNRYTINTITNKELSLFYILKIILKIAMPADIKKLYRKIKYNLL